MIFSKEVKGMANEENLKPGVYRFTQEDRKKAAAAKEEKARVSSMLKILMVKPIEDPATRRGLEALGFKKNEMLNSALVAVAIFKKAAKGDVSAMRLLLELTGDDPAMALKTARFMHEKEMDKKRYW